jgi:NAD(P)-dependent dehydrogenase (short-subunit alcohol dehydrogenase family)
MHRTSLLEGRVAIITGGGKGIGAAVADALSQAGASVTVAARTTSEIGAVAKRISKAGGEAIAVSTDITDGKQVQKMVGRTMSAFGRVDFLVNCAAVTSALGQVVWETELDDWQECLDTNLIGAFMLSRTILPLMLAQGSGRLLFISSGLSEMAIPRTSAYCASRAGLNQFVNVLAAELKGSGVTANLVYPGIVETKGLQNYRAAMFQDGRGAFEGRAASREPAEAANLLLWLCSPPTAQMNGQHIAINDPMTRRGLARFLHHLAL